MGARAKAPAYQWYPKDFETDEAVKLMTYEQEGIYRRLLDHQWLHGGIPSRGVEVARLLPKISRARFLSAIWPRLAPQFRHTKSKSRVVNLRLERQRVDAAKHRAGKQFAAALGNAKRWRSIANHRSASASASASTQPRLPFPLILVCRHTPRCVSTWFCGQVSEVEAAVRRGVLEAEAGAQLIAKWRAGGA